MSKIKEELKAMDENQLQDKVEELRREYFSARLNATAAHIKDYSQFKKLRKDLARALTFLSQRISSNF